VSLRPTQLALLGVLLLAVSLAGVPFFLHTHAIPALHGVVVDGRGFGVSEASVFLFSEDEMRLVEETTSDEDGDFDFLLGVESGRVLVRPRAESGFLPAWSPANAGRAGRLPFVLRPARTLAVDVRDERGAPVPQAEVRVYEVRSEPAVVALARTDAEGHAVLLAPERAHVAAFAPTGPHLARWRFDADIASEGARLELVLPPARTVSGIVRGASGPLAGIVLVSWEEGLAEGWNGFTRSDEEGRFELPCSAAPTLVRALDPAGAHLPARLRVAERGDELVELTLERGTPLVVQTTRGGLPLESLVWSWSPQAEAWSWGVRSSASGRATVPVAKRFSIRAEPLDPAFAPLDAWDVAYEVGTLRLEAPKTP
jgi:hypothetical protein